MAAALDLDELVEHFTLAPDELDLVRNKSGATRLAFALFLNTCLGKGGSLGAGRSWPTTSSST